MSDEQQRYEEEKYHYEMDCEEMSNHSTNQTNDQTKPMAMPDLRHKAGRANPATSRDES